MIPSPNSAERGELLACPFCGGNDLFVEREDFTSAFIFCNGCSARGPIECQESDDEETPGWANACKIWNTRTPPATLDAGVREALTETAIRIRDKIHINQGTGLSGPSLDIIVNELAALSTQPAGGVQGSIATKQATDVTGDSASELRIQCRLAWNNWPDNETSRREIAAHEARDPNSAASWDRVVAAIQKSAPLAGATHNTGERLPMDKAVSGADTAPLPQTEARGQS